MDTKLKENLTKLLNAQRADSHNYYYVIKGDESNILVNNAIGYLWEVVRGGQPIYYCEISRNYPHGLVVRLLRLKTDSELRKEQRLGERTSVFKCQTIDLR